MTDERTGETPQPHPQPEPTPPSTGDTGAMLMNFARGAKGLALACFLLPWVTVSCAGRPLVQMTGLGLATGDINPMSGAADFPGAGSGPNPMANLTESAQPDILVLVAGVLIVAGLIASFVLPRRSATLAGMVTSVSALVLIAFDVLVRIKGGVESRIREGSAGDAAKAGPTDEFSRSMQQQMEQMVQAITVNPAIGFWLTVLLLAAAAVLFKIVHGRRTAGP